MFQQEGVFSHATNRSMSGQSTGDREDGMPFNEGRVLIGFNGYIVQCSSRNVYMETYYEGLA